MKKIAILGLGNLMRTDDAVGMLTLESLRDWACSWTEVILVEGGTLGLDLLDSLWGVTHLVAIDAVDAGEEPGTILRFAGDQLTSLPTSKSVHLLGFADLLGVLALMNAAPREVVLLGMQPEYTGWGTELTAPLRARQDDFVQAVVRQVREWIFPEIRVEDISPNTVPSFSVRG